MSKRIAIVGAGSSGLTAIKCCLDEGLQPVCFERYSDIGGIWNYDENISEGKASVYKSCVINTSKEMMAFSDFPMPVYFPPFLPHSYLLKYLRMYAQHFDLIRHISFNRSVENIRPTEDHSTTGRWSVCYTTEDNIKDVKEEIFDGVMVCTGHHSAPHRPHFAGDECFKGKMFHSQQYRTPDTLKNKRVLVIGLGNSAVDIAVDASSTAAQVFVSTRRGAWVVSRMGFWGLPNDLLANNRSVFYMGRDLLQWTVEKMANFRFDHEAYGVKPLHRGLEAHPTINDELPHQIMKGLVKVKSNVRQFTPDGVHFEDGSYEEVDVVVFATGYNYECPFIDKSVLKIEENRTRLYKYVFPPRQEHPTLAMIGLIQAVGAVMPISEIQSRWYCRVLKGNCKLPPREDMLADISAREDFMAKRYLNTQRHTLEAMWVPYMDEIAELIGVRPSMVRLAQKDIKLAIRCLFGPCVPAQYRLEGPGQWTGAKHCIQQAFTNCTLPLTTRKASSCVTQKVTPITATRKNNSSIETFPFMKRTKVSIKVTRFEKTLMVHILTALLFVIILPCLLAV